MLGAVFRLTERLLMGNPLLVSVDSDTNLFPASVMGPLNKRYQKQRVDSSLSYKKRLVHNLVYQHPDAAAASSQFGASLYPQTFVIDTTANEILVISGPPQIVSVYNWTTGAYKGVVYSLGRSGTSESADIRYINGKRYLYTVDVSGKAGTLTRFDITTTPQKLTTINPTDTYTMDVLNSAHYRYGHWVSASITPNSGSDTSFRNRGRLTFYDDNFTQTGMADFPVSTTGGTRQYQTAGMPKMQGFDEGPGFFVYGCGGGTSGATTLTAYHYQGVRVFTPGGAPIVDSLTKADKTLAILNANGCNGDIIENEGVQIVGNSIYTLSPINTGSSAGATTGGIVVLEEFSQADDAIDFSSAAANWTMTDPKRIQSGSYPVSSDGFLRNQVTWDKLNSLTDICVYMQAIGQDRFAFYSSDAPVTDSVGTAIPAGYYVEVLNRNQMSFVVRLYGNGSVRFLTLSTTDGTTWTQTWGPEKVNFTPASGLQTINAQTFNRYWIDGGSVFFEFGVQNSTSGQTTLAAGNNVILAAGGLPARYRPEFTANAAVAGHTSGPAMRFSADNTGLVQLVGVPASTHNYAKGVVTWPVGPVL